MLVEDRQVEVEADRQVEAKALVAPAFRQQRDAALDGVGLAAELDRLALPADRRRPSCACRPNRHWTNSLRPAPISP